MALVFMHCMHVAAMVSWDLMKMPKVLFAINMLSTQCGVVMLISIFSFIRIPDIEF